MIAPRVLLVDTHTLCREALGSLLERDGRVVVVGAVAPDADVPHAASRLGADVVLIDVLENQSAGLHALRRLEESDSPARAVLLTEERSGAAAVPGVIAGARGVVGRNDTSDLLVRSILGVARGEFWVSRKLFAEVLDTVRTSQARLEEMVPKSLSESSPVLEGLSPREFQIIAAIVEGQVNKEIAETLQISEYTVKHHLTRIFNKLNVTNRVELAMLAVERQAAPNDRETSLGWEKSQ